MNIKLAILLVIFLSNIISNYVLFSQPKQPLRQKWELVSKKLEWAREIQISFDDQSVIDLLNSAEADLRRARKQIEVGRRLVALRFINNANRNVNQALFTLLREPLKRRLMKLEDKIEEVKNELTKNQIPETKDLLQAGIESKNLAEQAFKEWEFQKSLKHFFQAEFQIQKALDIVRNRDKSIQQQTEDEALRFGKLLSQSQHLLSLNSEPTVQKNYKSVLELSQKAERVRSAGNFRLAIDYYHQATRLLLRTIGIAEGRTDRAAGRALEEITALDELIDTIQQKVKPVEDDERMQFFMSRIQQLQEDAHLAMESNDYKLALLNTQLARELIERILKKLKE